MMDLDTILKIVALFFGGIITLSSFVAAVVYLTDQYKKTAIAANAEEFKKLNTKIDDFKNDVNKRFDTVEAKQEKSDIEACKNFLVRCLDDFERGIVSPVIVERYWKEFDYYIAKGKNSSIKTRTNALVQSGVLTRDTTKGE